MRRRRVYVLKLNTRGYYAEERPLRPVPKKRATNVTHRTAVRRARKLLRAGYVKIEIEHK